MDPVLIGGALAGKVRVTDRNVDQSFGTSTRAWSNSAAALEPCVGLPWSLAPGWPSSGTVLNFHTSWPSASRKAPIHPFAKLGPDGPMMTRSS
jgi:hypothetical protein